jgi:uncharacterized damage-inducible protein DinB
MENMTTFKNALISETRRRIIEESIPRIKKCLYELDEKEIWHRPNDHSNSVGNLILHLCGNVTQWIGSGLGKLEDHRLRDSEFEEKGPLPTATLLKKLDDLIVLINEVLETISEQDLLELHDVQVYKESGVSILVHVIEHFSYHTGQITYYVKWRKNMDTGYYMENLG